MFTSPTVKSITLDKRSVSNRDATWPNASRIPKSLLGFAFLLRGVQWGLAPLQNVMPIAQPGIYLREYSDGSILEYSWEYSRENYFPRELRYERFRDFCCSRMPALYTKDPLYTNHALYTMVIIPFSEFTE